MRQPVLATCNRQKHLLLRAIEVARRTLGHLKKNAPAGNRTRVTSSFRRKALSLVKER